MIKKNDKFQKMKIKQAKDRLRYLLKNEPDFVSEYESLLEKWGIKVR